jgi:hypothetical protein
MIIEDDLIIAENLKENLEELSKYRKDAFFHLKQELLV